MQRGVGGGHRVEQLALQLGDALHPLGRRFADHQRANDLHVPADIVFIARVDGQLDQLVGLGLGHARFDAVMEGMEPFIDRIGYPRAVHHVLIVGRKHESQRP